MLHTRRTLLQKAPPIGLDLVLYIRVSVCVYNSGALTIRRFSSQSVSLRRDAVISGHLASAAAAKKINPLPRLGPNRVCGWVVCCTYSLCRVRLFLFICTRSGGSSAAKSTFASALLGGVRKMQHVAARARVNEWNGLSCAQSNLTLSLGKWVKVVLIDSLAWLWAALSATWRNVTHSRLEVIVWCCMCAAITSGQVVGV